MVKKESFIIISDTGPIIFLLQINELKILNKLYGEITITSDVYKEIETPVQKKLLDSEIKKGWIKRINLKPLEIFQNLGSGEASSISLALKYEECLLIMDEKKARAVARANGIKITGSIGILLLAKKKKLIKDMNKVIQQINQNNFWISEDLITKLKQ